MFFEGVGVFLPPTPTGGLKVPPPIRATLALPEPSESNGGEEGDKKVPPPGAPCFSKEWGFSYPHSLGGTKSPPSYPLNSGLDSPLSRYDHFCRADSWSGRPQESIFGSGGMEIRLPK